ncbi:MAG TPA: hypothetical protein VN885_06155 [Candidatus Acidoferrales bacterium]|nr:hypothetical protein [Candidatus Acidoferrales bacterium]
MSDSYAAETTLLFRPVGPKELALIEQSGFAEFPPRLEGQPYFYPVQNEEHARQIARDWNAKEPEIGAGFVMRFRVQTDYPTRFELRTVGAAIHQEYWSPAQELPEFNRDIVGTIEIIAELRGPQT